MSKDLAVLSILVPSRPNRSLYIPSLAVADQHLLVSASKFAEGLQPSRLETTNSFVALVMSLCCWED